MNKRFYLSKLELKLILCVAFSFLISTGIFFLLQDFGESMLNSYFDKTSFVEKQRNEAIDGFRSYVADNNLTISNRDEMSKWVIKEKYVNLYIYKDNNLIYDFNENDSNADFMIYGKTSILSSKLLYDINFADTNAKMYMECFFEYKYYYLIGFIDVAISFFCFMIIVLFFIKRKTTDIGKLEKAIKVLEGGNLTHEIAVNGNDELSSLAQSLNEMRKAFIERLENEEKARLANSELITAMSHDLRTPLTALLGYLDIIEYKKYKTEENLRQYIHSSREKAYQIKYLSDKLFEYFIVFNINEEDLELETFDGNELLEQLFEEQIFVIEDNGFKYQIDSCNERFYMDVNLISMRRVFDNIFSNIIKYAEKSQPIKIKYYIEKEQLYVYIVNQINNNSRPVSSTGIGMKTCEKIIKSHNGEIVTNKLENTFCLQIILHVKLQNSD